MARKVEWEETYDGLIRHVTGRSFHRITVIDMDDAVGEEENKGHPRFVVELAEVDLDAISDEERERALESVGASDEELTDLGLAEALISYGLKAPLGDWSGNGEKTLVNKAKRESRRLEEDEDAHEAALDKPVNRIGSTAREFMVGDLDSAMARGLSKGDDTARLMAKISHPIPEPLCCQVQLGAIPSDDPIAFMAGFMDGFQGSKLPNPGEDSLADAYLKGRDFGGEVRMGKRPIPGWVK